MPQLIKYPKIKSNFVPGKLIVTEKINGSNIGIGYVDGALQIQSKNTLLHKEARLQFGLKHIIQPLILLVDKILSEGRWTNFLVYGEIFGNKNNRKMNYDDSEASEKAFGSSTVYFRAFDFYDVDRCMFLKYSEAIQLFERVGMPYVPILDIQYETFLDLYSLAQNYPSAYSPHCVEGFVVKKDQDCFRFSRPIFKVKRREWSHSYRAFPLDQYVNADRFRSAYSKIGEDREKIQEEMVRNVLEDILVHFESQVKIEVQSFLKDYEKHVERIKGPDAHEETPEEETRGDG